MSNIPTSSSSSSLSTPSQWWWCSMIKLQYTPFVSIFQLDQSHFFLSYYKNYIGNTVTASKHLRQYTVPMMCVWGCSQSTAHLDKVNKWPNTAGIRNLPAQCWHSHNTPTQHTHTKHTFQHTHCPHNIIWMAQTLWQICKVSFVK